MVLFAFARRERDRIDEKTAVLFKPAPNSPAELNRIRDELSKTELTQTQLERELDGRMRYLESLEGAQFYISIDTRRQKMQFRFGRDVVREADVQVGEAKTIKAKDGRTWTFLPLKGGFNVVGKEYDYAWRAPEWLYAMNGERMPDERPAIKNGLGKYVIVLPDNYIIHSPPPADSPLHGPKPGSFMVPEEDLAAIWPRVTKETRVYIF